jgi:hypothetical protein
MLVSGKNYEAYIIVFLPTFTPAFRLQGIYVYVIMPQLLESMQILITFHEFT